MLDISSYQSVWHPAYILFQLIMHLIKNFLPLGHGVILKFACGPVSIHRVIEMAAFPYTLSPRFGSNGSLTDDACSSHRVRILGKVWKTYLLPLASERRKFSITSFAVSPLRLAAVSKVFINNSESLLTRSAPLFQMVWISRTPESCCNAFQDNSAPSPNYASCQQV